MLRVREEVAVQTVVIQNRTARKTRRNLESISSTATLKICGYPATAHVHPIFRLFILFSAVRGYEIRAWNIQEGRKKRKEEERGGKRRNKMLLGEYGRERFIHYPTVLYPWIFVRMRFYHRQFVAWKIGTRRESNTGCSRLGDAGCDERVHSLAALGSQLRLSGGNIGFKVDWNESVERRAQQEPVLDRTRR